MADLANDTVQQTLCIPLYGRMVAAEKYPDLFPDRDAARIVAEMGMDYSGEKICRMQYMWMNSLIRQYNLAWEIGRYLADHPAATVVELGAGLSCLRRQIGNVSNPWYCIDLPDVVALRERHIPTDGVETNVACDLNDLSWFDAVRFDPADGIVFVAGGLFYYFEKDDVKRLFVSMAEHFPGGMIAFDACSALGLKGVTAEVRLSGNTTKSFFSLERPKDELEAWSENIVNVSEKEYVSGYLKGGYRQDWFSWMAERFMRLTHMSFMVHAEFRVRSEKEGA